MSGNTKLLDESKRIKRESHEKIIKEIENNKIKNKDFKKPSRTGHKKENELKKIAEKGILRLIEEIQKVKKNLNNTNIDVEYKGLI
jgi:predicted transcriptional regulator YheO